MGVHDVRLTGGEPLVRRDFPRLAGMLARGPRRRGPLGHDERLPARARRRGARRRRDQPLQRLDRLAPARPLLRDDAPRRAAARAARPRGPRAVPRGAPDQGQRGRDARLHRAGGAPVRGVRALASLRGALHRVHAARRRPQLDAGQRADRRRDPRGDQRRLPARGRAARGPRDRPRLPLRRRPGARSASSTRSASRSAATATASASPPTASCGPACSRSTRPTCARRCGTARATTTSSGSSATRSGARSSSTTSTTRASCSRRAR